MSFSIIDFSICGDIIKIHNTWDQPNIYAISNSASNGHNASRNGLNSWKIWHQYVSK